MLKLYMAPPENLHGVYRRSLEWLAGQPSLEIGSADHLAVAWLRSGALFQDAESAWQDRSRPFRAPHHTISCAGMIGARRRPGEVSLATGGVLLLDDMPEFRLSVIRELGKALQQKRVDCYPARPLLVVCMAMRCPCGASGSKRKCFCTPESIRRYTERRDRFFDLLGGGERSC